VSCVYTAPYATSYTDDKSSLTALAYQELKRRLLVGEFRLGTRLAETTLAELVGVSRTPVREALARLHAEGFVVRLPEGGFSPAAPDLHTVHELYDVRRGLEFTALHLPGGHDNDQLLAIRAHWSQMDVPACDAETTGDFVLHDEDFHVRLAASAGNRSLTDLLLLVNERIRVVRMHDFLSVDRIVITIAEHLSIVDALLQHDRQLAQRRLNRHLAVSRKVVEQRAAIALSRMVQVPRG
jgi:DNA-binding GntR family transcriptional regulator